MTIHTQPNRSPRFPPTVVAENLYLGEQRPKADFGEAIERRSPGDNDDVVGIAPVSSKAQVRHACELAGIRQRSWAKVPAPQRGVAIGRLAEMLGNEKETLAAVMVREVGKPIHEAMGEIQEVIDTAEFFQSEGRRPEGVTLASELPNKRLETRREPLGVVGLITASNFPCAVPSWTIIPAVLAGNAVVWKPSEDAPISGYLFGMMCQSAGLPVSVVHGYGAGSAGEALLNMVDEGLLQKFAFTGSSAVGRIVGEVAGGNLQRPLLELGGKNPMVVLPDADLDSAVEGALFGAFGTAGQRCTSLANLILHDNISDAFLQKFLARLGQLKLGDPTLGEEVFSGPLISERYLHSFLAHLEAGKRSGANLLTSKNGRITSANKPANFVGDPDKGFYVFPSVWDGVAIDDDLAQTEVFGPTVNVIRVADLDQAIRIANGTKYGLTAAIYTRDLYAASRFQEEVKAGMVSINNSTSGAEAHGPFGGVKASGIGRQGGAWVMDEFTCVKSVNLTYGGGFQRAQMDTEAPPAAEALDLSGLRPTAGT